MTSRIFGPSTLRIVAIMTLVVFATAIVLVSQASGQETRTLDVELVFTEESFEVARAVGNEIDGDGFAARGDILSGQAAVYRAGATDGERIGTFYFMASTTAEPQHAETAANHLFAQAYFELFGEGTLAVSGLVNFMKPYTTTLTGGTASYSGAGGTCIATPGEETETWSCTVR